MRRPLRVLLLLSGTLAILTSTGLRLSAWGFARQPARPFAQLEPGMTADQVRRVVGSPKRIARQILYHRHLEQWIYDQPTPARLLFLCPRGQKPQLLWKELLPEEKVERGQEPNAR